ncbi:MAG: helix-turn-helix domain-containing protein [Betaproteobacteria bacterium]|nr:MAG: helix-turn-helix domain-containing protein [Betaproteobacteria bacterium]
MTSAPDDNRAAAPAPGGEVGAGERLSRARCAVGLSVDDVARHLKYSARQIEALEQGRYAQLPGSTILRGMVRSYARLLKLDAEPLLQQLTGAVAATPEIEASVPFRKPIPFSNSARRINLGYALLSLGVLGAVFVVVLGWPGGPSGESKLSFVPAGRAPAEAMTPGPAPAVERVPLAAVGTPQAVVPSAPATPAAASDADSPPPAPAPAAAAADARRLTLHFDQKAWVEVRGRDGRVLTSQLNAAGTTRVVEGAPPFRLVIGNAQHVQLRYGERSIDLAQHAQRDVARLTLE